MTGETVLDMGRSDPQKIAFPHVDALASDGLPVHLRSLHESDTAAFLALHRNLSAGARYRRFFSHQMPPDGLLERLLDLGEANHAVLGAETNNELIAAATLSRTGPLRGEVAFAVADAYQGHGLGTLLFEQLAASARSVGMEALEAETLPFNDEMIDVFERAGYKVDSTTDRDSTRLVMRLDDSANDAIDAREAVATVRSMRRVLEPDTVAVIGESLRPDSKGDAVFENLTASGFTGAAYPVNPEARNVGGVRAWPSIAEVPDRIDVAIICVPPGAVLDVIEQCGRAGVQAVVILTAGLVEPGADGRRAAMALLRTARQYGMRIIGPNCVGILTMHPGVRLNATSVSSLPRSGTVGLASQSGARDIALLAGAAELGIGVRSFVSLGAKLDVSGNDLLQYWEADPGTAVGVLCLESFGNPRKFVRIARRFCAKKPLLVVKPKSSHTPETLPARPAASMASSDQLADAVFAETGIIRVDTLHQLFGVLGVVEQQPLPSGNRVAFVGNSQSSANLAAGAWKDAGLVVAELTQSTTAALERLVPCDDAVASPLDLIASSDPETFRKGLELVLADDNVDAVLALHADSLRADPAVAAAAMSRAALVAPDKPLVAAGLAAELGRHQPPTDTEGRVIPVFEVPEEAVAAIGHAARLSSWRSKQDATPVELPDVERGRASALLDRVLADAPEGRWLTPTELGELLRSYGIPRTAISPDVVRTPGSNAIQVDLESDRSVGAAADLASAGPRPAMAGAPEHPLKVPAVKTVAGAFQDPAFGPIVMFGAGGALRDSLKVRNFALAPLTDRSAASLVDGLETGALVDGLPNSRSDGRDAASDLVCRLGQLVADHPRLLSLTVASASVTAHSLVCADVRAKVGPTIDATATLRRRMRGVENIQEQWNG